MNKFQNAKIYKIIDNTSDLIYIGSTCKTLNQRLKKHEYDYKRYIDRKYHFVTSFKIIQHNNYRIELIKIFPCENKQQLCIAEGIEIKHSKINGLNVINKNIAGQTDQEYRNINRNKINEYKKKKFNCSCGGKYTQNNKAQHDNTKLHQDYINKPIINITININNVEDLNLLELDFLKAINK
jgi:hypothetical protein